MRDINIIACRCMLFSWLWRIHRFKTGRRSARMWRQWKVPSSKLHWYQDPSNKYALGLCDCAIIASIQNYKGCHGAVNIPPLISYYMQELNVTIESIFPSYFLLLLHGFCYCGSWLETGNIDFQGSALCSWSYSYSTLNQLSWLDLQKVWILDYKEVLQTLTCQLHGDSAIPASCITNYCVKIYLSRGYNIYCFIHAG